MAITGIPEYKGEPLAVFIRCPACFTRYLVWCAHSEPYRANERAGDYVFINARKQSAVECKCGELLPLMEILTSEGVM